MLTKTTVVHKPEEALRAYFSRSSLWNVYWWWGWRIKTSTDDFWAIKTARHTHRREHARARTDTLLLMGGNCVQERRSKRVISLWSRTRVAARSKLSTVRSMFPETTSLFTPLCFWFFSKKKKARVMCSLRWMNIIQPRLESDHQPSPGRYPCTRAIVHPTIFLNIVLLYGHTVSNTLSLRVAIEINQINKIKSERNKSSVEGQSMGVQRFY